MPATDAARPRAETLGLGLALAGFALFSSHDAVIKSLGGVYPVAQIIFAVNALALGPVAAFFLIHGGPAALCPRRPPWIVARCAVLLAAIGCGFTAITRLPLAEAYALIFATPLIVTVLAVPLLGERVGWRRLSAVGAGLVGVLIVLRPGFATPGLGHAAALGAAFFGACAGLIVRHVGRDERLSVMMLYPMAVNLSVTVWLLPGRAAPVDAAAVAIFALAGALFVAAQACIINAFRRAPAALVAPAQYSQVIWALLYGYVFFREGIDLWVGLGAAVVIASGAYILFRESRPRVSAAKPVSAAPMRAEVPTPKRPPP